MVYGAAFKFTASLIFALFPRRLLSQTLRRQAFSDEPTAVPNPSLHEVTGSRDRLSFSLIEPRRKLGLKLLALQTILSNTA